MNHHLSHDLAKQNGNGINTLSKSIRLEGMRVLQRFGEVARILGCKSENMRGVGTAVFRKADNGAEYLRAIKKRLGIGIECINQSLEGKIGYATGWALMQPFVSSNSRNVAPTLTPMHPNPIVWDSGGGSFQISHGLGAVATTLDASEIKVRMYGSAIGSTTVTEMAVTLQGKSFAKCQSPNPLSQGGIESLIKTIKARLLCSKPEWLAAAITSTNDAGLPVVAIGGATCAFRICCLAVSMTGSSGDSENIPPSQQFEFTVTETRAAMKRLVRLTDPELEKKGFPQPSMVLPKLALVLSVMEVLGLVRVRYAASNGSTRGIAITPCIWS